MFNDTICAISTALKGGAISIVRMSGEDSFKIIQKISKVKNIKGNNIVYSHIYDGDEIIDEVLISFFEKNKSYTREDMVEINCHGGTYVTRLVLNLLLKEGCRLALNGEFTKRAYLNGRINLSEAEGVNDLINATNAIQAKSAIKSLNGSIENLIGPLMDEMKNVISMIEVNIDYPEYEDEVEMSNDIIKPYINKWLIDTDSMIQKAERFRLIKDGIDTVIIGKPNVGKSSLLNALLNEDKAIVTDIAGTTRDLVEGKVILDNITLNIVDTAGIRESDDKIEKIGIEKSKDALNKAELILLVVDPNDYDEQDEELLKLCIGKNYLVVNNKSDISKGKGINISALNKDINELTAYLNEKYKDDVSLINEDILNNERQISLMKKCQNELKEMYMNIDYLTTDVVVNNLMDAYAYLCEILGIEYKEDLIDHMFRNFCLGK